MSAAQQNVMKDRPMLVFDAAAVHFGAFLQLCENRRLNLAYN